MKTDPADDGPRHRGGVSRLLAVVVAVVLAVATSSTSTAAMIAASSWTVSAAAAPAEAEPVASAPGVDTYASTPGGLRAGDAVAASEPVAGQRVGPHEPVLPGQRRIRAPDYDQTPVGFRVAPNTALNPSGVRFSQTSVNGVDDIASSMRANGWVGDSIDVVRMPDGGLTSLDNTRVLAAHRAGINVQARVHAFDDLLPSGSVGRFTTPKGGAPTSWGDAVSNRIGAQSAPYRNRWPMGSPFTGWAGG